MVGYRKVKKTGKWAVCGPTDEVKVGVVTVTKKNGDTQDVEVVELGKPFRTDEGEELVYGYLEEREAE